MEQTLSVISEQEILEKSFKIYGDFENPLFLAKDVAEWIDYQKTSKGAYNVAKMLQMVDNDEKIKSNVNPSYTDGIHNVDTTYTDSIHNEDTTLSSDEKNMDTTSKARKTQDMWFLTEDGVYEVLMLSRKPIAKQFKKEVKKLLHELRTSAVASPSSDIAIAIKTMTEQTAVLTAMLNQMNQKIDSSEQRFNDAQKSLLLTESCMTKAITNNSNRMDQIEKQQEMLMQVYADANKRLDKVADFVHYTTPEFDVDEYKTILKHIKDNPEYYDISRDSIRKIVELFSQKTGEDQRSVLVRLYKYFKSVTNMDPLKYRNKTGGSCLKFIEDKGLLDNLMAVIKCVLY